MGAVCPKCGMKSDRDDICTWCNADIPKPPKPQQPPAAPGTKPGPSIARGPRPAPGGEQRVAPLSHAPAAPAPRAMPQAPPAPQRPGWVVPTIVVGSGALVLVLGLLLVGISASGPPADEGEWTAFTSLDKSFTAYYPAGWGEPSNSGSGGSFVSVVWKGNKLCRVEVHGSSGAGTRGDIAAAKERLMAGNLGPGEQLPVESTADGALLDGFKRDTWLARRPVYEEGSPSFSHDFAGTRSACVQYTFNKRAGLLSVPMKGIRWASQQGDYGYHVTAEAPAKHWAKFEPIARKIVAAVQLGGAG